MNNLTLLVTGAAGFIGYHLCKKLCDLNIKVIGIDNLNDYYDVKLKSDRLNQLKENISFKFYKADLVDGEKLNKIVVDENINTIIHLAAQAGVRYSIENPTAYINSNIIGFFNVLETCRNNNIKHLLYASSSSVYGANKNIPFSVNDSVDHPVSLYAATKKSNELMAHTYSNLYNLPTTGLRFFTVYGPWGRPDMAYFKFTKAIIEGDPIMVFNRGKMQRDFTYIDDIVEGIVRLIEKVPIPNDKWDAKNPDKSSSFAPYKLYNIGNNNPVELLEFIRILEEGIGKKSIMNFLPMQAGDVEMTYANIDHLVDAVDFRPDTPLNIGLGHFINWYKDYYKVI